MVHLRFSLGFATFLCVERVFLFLFPFPVEIGDLLFSSFSWLPASPGELLFGDPVASQETAQAHSVLDDEPPEAVEKYSVNL